MQKRSDRLTRHYRRSQVMLYSILLPAFALAMTLGGGLESTRRIALVVLGFSGIVFVHELGHFLVARACSVKCEAFSIGIGPRLCGWKKGVGFNFGGEPKVVGISKEESQKIADEQTGVTFKEATSNVDRKAIGECDYRVSLLPLGGYVRMLGQDDMDPTKVSDDPHAFNRRPIWQRMCIVSAGVIMNLICAAVIFSVVFSPGIGVMFPPAQVGQVLYGTPAYQKGMQFGDRIVSIDGTKDLGFLEFADVVIASALSSGKDEIVFEVERPGVPGTIKIPIKPEQLQESGFLAIGIEPMPSLNIAVDGKDSEGTAESTTTADEKKELAKIERGDRITAVNGTAVDHYIDLRAILEATGNKPITLTLARKHAAAPIVAKITPRIQLLPGVESFPAVLGIGPRMELKTVTKGSRADKAGIKAGDIVLKVGERSNPTEGEFHDIIVHSPGKSLSLLVERDGKPVDITVTPEDNKGRGLIGVSIVTDAESTVVAVRDPNSAAADFGFAPGSDPVQITAIDGTPVNNWWDITDILRQKKGGESVAVTFKAGQQEAIRTLALNDAQVKEIHEKTAVKLGLSLEYAQQLQRADSTGQAMVMGLQHTKKFILQVYMTLAGMVRQTVSVDNLHGPLAIAKVGHDVQDKGQVWLWYLMALVSVNLAVANFLPLPIVDGGLFLLLILEKVRGRPLSIKTQTIIQTVGIVLLACVFLFVTIHNDIPFLMPK